MFFAFINYIAKQYCIYKLNSLQYGDIMLFDKDKKLQNEQTNNSTNVSNIHVLDDSIYKDVMTSGELGLGRGYVQGKWTTTDIEKLMIILARNMNSFGRELLYSYNPFAFNVKKKNKVDDKRQIVHHYDVGNKFYELFLDHTFMAYSTGYWKTPNDTLETSIQNKLDDIIEKLDIKEGDQVLDLGCGWGLIANYIYGQKKPNLTCITVSDEQLKYAQEHASKEITFMQKDYRDLVGQFDKIYSIEMIEHVGKHMYDTYFNRISSCLKQGGKAYIQTSISTQEGTDMYNQSQFILTDVFPGGHIPRISWILEALAKNDHLRLVSLEFVDGHNFANTFKEWYNRLKANVKLVDQKLYRTYEYYFNSCVGLYRNNRLASCIVVVEKCDPNV